MEEEDVDYRCSACRKAIKNKVIKCKTCIKLFYHPGCVNKHKILDKNQEYVPCMGPFEEFLVESEQESNVRAMGTAARRDRATATGTSTNTGSGSANKVSGIDAKVDWVIKIVREVRNEMACKNEIKAMIKVAVQEEIGYVQRELEDIKKMIQGIACGTKEVSQRSYSEAVKDRRENIIIVKPNAQQESEATKKVIKEQVDIKSMAMGVTSLKKGSKETVIMGCETGEEIKILKETVQARLGDSYKVMESPQLKPKLRINNIDAEEMKLEDKELINVIRKQNKMGEIRMRILKRISKGKSNQSGRKEEEEGSVIMETDEETHEMLVKKARLNVGWKRCPVFNHINVKRCFKCWGFYHIAKNCTREETCFKCAGNHNSRACSTEGRKCVNCMYKIKTYNVKISDEHDALSMECPTFKRALQEEKRRAGWEEKK